MHEFGTYVGAVYACLLACGSSVAAERAEHVVVPPRTAEISRGLGPDAPAASVAEYACPMRVEGADVLLVPVKGGSAFVFTTALASPVEVRHRAWWFASSYNTRAASGRRELDRSPAGFPTMAQYSEVAAGARVEIRPLALEDTDELRAHLRRQLLHMQETRRC